MPSQIYWLFLSKKVIILVLIDLDFESVTILLSLINSFTQYNEYIYSTYCTKI